MAGLQVTKDLLDLKSAQAVLAVREAFDQVETIFEYLATVPANAEGGDPLTLPLDQGGKFGYTADEAYLIRFVFESLHGLAVQPILDTGRKLTGLE